VSGIPPGGARPVEWPRWQRLARRVIVLVLTALVIAVLVRRWGDVRPLLGRLSVAVVAASLLAVVTGMLGSFLAWRALLTDFGYRLPFTGGMRVYFLGNLAKYVPGSVWQAVAQTELARDYRVPRRASAAALIVSMLAGVGTGALVAVLTLPFVEPEALHRYWWVLLALPVAAVVLWPPALNRIMDLVLRLARREPLAVSASVGGMLRAVGWDLASWVGFGAQVWLLARALGVHHPALFLQATGAFAAAWCVGFLIVFAPAGGGARELALVLLLQPIAPTATAWVIALVSRLLFTVGDLAWGGTALLAERRRLRRQPEPVREAGTSARDGRPR
jgi:glycosyltransferase 2 family protein